MSKKILYLVNSIAIISLFVIVMGFKTESLLLSGLDKSSANQVNTILVNLSCSYISGYLVYFLTVLLPYNIKRSKISPIINEKFGKIQHSIEIVMKSFFSVFFPKEDSFTKDDFVSEIKKTSLHLTYTPESSLYKSCTLLDMLYTCRNDVKRSIDEIMLYREYLPIDTIQLLESIKYSKCFSYLNLITKSLLLDNEVIRKELGEDLFKWYERLREES